MECWSSSLDESGLSASVRAVHNGVARVAGNRHTAEVLAVARQPPGDVDGPALPLEARALSALGLALDCCGERSVLGLPDARLLLASPSLTMLTCILGRM